jgi:hypothetical protein
MHNKEALAIRPRVSSPLRTIQRIVMKFDNVHLNFNS